MAKDISLISWNVNGVRAAERKGFLDFLNQGGFDIVALQETKVSDHSVLSPDLLNPPGYNTYWHGSKEKKGYSGVSVITKILPIKVKDNFGPQSLLSKEGRVLELKYPNFTLLNIYFPNGKQGQSRLDFKLTFYKEFLSYLKKLSKTEKNIIFCGDVNTAHQELDLARPKENEKISGFLPAERLWLDKFTEAGFIDTFRHFHPDQIKYSWWDQKSRARERNVGWRIDYFFVSKNLLSKVKEIDILDDVFGSDHAPVSLTLKL